MPDRLKNRIAIVTGADSGIGRATAEAFAAEGADVAITYHSDRSGAEETVAAVEAFGRRAITIRCDQRESEQVDEVVSRTTADLGSPFVLMNNAGIDNSGKLAIEMTDEEWDNVVRTDLYGPFYFCRSFIRARQDAGGGGRIINVTSVHEEIPRIRSAGYDAAKGGLRNLTRSLCLELAPHRINVNSIAPGMVLTPMNQAALEDPRIRREQESNIPWKRAGEPREVAHLAVYLASDDADYVTGQSFTIDGGLSLMLGQGA